MSLTLVRWQNLTAAAWKNGGGVTRRLAAAPAAAMSEDIDWSVSIADIDKEGPFSAFPGIDRILMLIGGTELVLEIDGLVHRLGVGDTVAFSGEAETTCLAPAGPVRALNLMTRRGSVSGTSRAVELAGAHRVTTTADEEAAVVVALVGEVSVGGDAVLNALDAIVMDGPGIFEVAGDGLIAELRIGRARASSYL